MPHRPLWHSYGSPAHDATWDSPENSRNPLTQRRAVVNAMIAMPLIYPDVRESQTPKRSAPPTPFQPLDPGVLNASIPAFFVGRDSDGFWLARDVKGENGGLFLLRSSALAFARRVSGRAGCATIVLSERFELDIENNGNPLIVHLKPLTRLAIAGWRRAVALAGRIAEAIERRSKAF
jgi:hypothetical protein